MPFSLVVQLQKNTGCRVSPSPGGTDFKTAQIDSTLALFKTSVFIRILVPYLIRKSHAVLYKAIQDI
jgi:hypothetical protein